MNADVFMSYNIMSSIFEVLEDKIQAPKGYQKRAKLPLVKIVTWNSMFIM